MSDINLGSIAEAVSAAVSVIALIGSVVAHERSKKTKGEVDGLRTQVSALQAQVQNLQIAQAANQKTNINVVVTTGSTGEQAAKQLDSGPGPG